VNVVRVDSATGNADACCMDDGPLVVVTIILVMNMLSVQLIRSEITKELTALTKNLKHYM
jgi:hypothetical protein